MHLGNGAVTPACAAITFAAASAGLGLGIMSARAAGFDRRRVATAGLLGAAVFAAQMINVPVLPFASAHLVGGVLLAWIVGPGLGALVMAGVLVAQATLLGDGGTMALGANIINMALLPALLVALVQPRLANVGKAMRFATAGAVAGLAVFLAAALIVGEVALFRSGAELSNLSAFTTQMLGTHALIAVGEGLATAGLLGLLAGGTVSLGAPARFGMARLAGIAAAAALLLALSPLSSVTPDGYEASLQRSGMTQNIVAILPE